MPQPNTSGLIILNIWFVSDHAIHQPAAPFLPAFPSAAHLAPSLHSFPFFKIKAVVLAAGGGGALDEPTVITATVPSHKPSLLSLYLILRACELWGHCFHLTEENTEGAEGLST